MGDRDPQPLQAAVGVDDGAVLLGVGLGGEDHGRVLGSPSVSTEACATTTAAECIARSHSGPVGLVAHRIGLHQVQRRQLAGGGGGGDLGAAAAGLLESA